MRRSQTLLPVRRLVPERDTAGYFAAVFFAVLALLVSLGYLAITLAESAAQERLLLTVESAERQGVEAMRREARETLMDITADLLVFRSLFGRENVAQEESVVARQVLYDFARSHRVYDQIRFIDNQGQERVRIDNEDAGPRLVPDDELQDKSSTRYVSDAMQLAREQVLITQFEPNIEYGQVELPLNPVFRIAMRVDNAGGRRDGFVVLNYRARSLLEDLASIGSAALGDPMVVTGQGLEALEALDVGTPEALLAAQTATSFAARFPEAWRAINRGTDRVASDGAGGIMVFTRFFPSQLQSPLTLAEDLTWTLPRADDRLLEGGLYLVSHVDAATLEEITGLSMMQSNTVTALLLLFAAGLAWLMALRLCALRSDSVRMRELAIRDSLTGLLTRGEFERRLASALTHAQRHHRAMGLLYIDLDRFKEVNDTLGHAAGDELLRQVGGVLSSAVRGSDFVGRIGGDEFAVALTEIRGRSDTNTVAQKLRESLSSIVELAGTRVEVGGSVGGATFPDDATTADGLFDWADQAMYRNKPKRRAA
jgi:diguanylate cyclase (GGDEF)-like protein